jgi:hypothetical protein
VFRIRIGDLYTNKIHEKATSDFCAGANSRANGIKVHLKMLDSGEIEVTRRPDKSKAKGPQQKMYDL